jgi:hypothetical protein
MAARSSNIIREVRPMIEAFDHAEIHGISPLEGVKARWPRDGAPPWMTIRYRRYSSGRAETAGGNADSSSPRLFVPPFQASIAAITSEILVRHDRSPDLLEAAIMELLANAIGHRSYGPEHRNDPIDVLDYTDAVRILSPGPAPAGIGGLSGELTGRFSRNPRLMAWLCDEGLAHQQGRGLGFVVRMCREAGYGIEVATSDRCVVASLTPQPTTWGHAPDRIRTTVTRDAREDRIVRFMRNSCGPVTAEDLRDGLTLRASTVRADLKRLVETGRLVRVAVAPRSPRQAYAIGEEPAK